MACEERDAAKRLLAEKQRAALSPEPSALSLNPEDSELEGGATVGPQATVYTQIRRSSSRWRLYRRGAPRLVDDRASRAPGARRVVAAARHAHVVG